MAKILCIEDSPEFYLYLTSVLNDHSVTLASDIKQALQLTQSGTHQFDLILLDISLPDGNGLKILPQLRQSANTSATPVIILSTDADVITKVAAFGVGADDYMAKPPDPNELKARIAARLRNAKIDEKAKSQIQLGDLIIDANSMRVEIHSSQTGVEMVDLTPSEFKILKMVASRPGQVYSRDQLIDHVWGIGKHITPRTVDAHVSNLRKKLLNSRVRVDTVRGAGYRAIIQDNSSNSGSES